MPCFRSQNTLGSVYAAMINSRTLNEIYGTVRDSTSVHTESRLDLAERILKPKTLADFADQNALQRLQAKFLAGEQSRRKKPRSAHTVRGYMNSVLSAVNWAYLQGWLPTAPKLRKIKTSKQKVMNGRPITVDEFRKVLDATGKVVGEDAAESWKHVLRGLWSSALRLDELMHVSWDKPGSIRPRLESGPTRGPGDPGGDAEERHWGEHPAPALVRGRTHGDAGGAKTEMGV